eukprot:CAMPEP_0168551244 /NCGR_PEP_ID=MMETSP0413-20121227/6065_1 /TAXON_ID=136452 /ORGANISM="Filamoeba nolandi, Strain NC-AS-23-1" /LENGTH=169 /DNA_ID=CAMNT_0008581749 /DNA_START=1 /DNA_END=507 /DNA_ORIENTATION=-
MTVTFALWGFIVTVATAFSSSIKTNCNTTGETYLSFGLALVALGSGGEFITDLQAIWKADDWKKEVPLLGVEGCTPCEHCCSPYIASGLRLISNGFLFFLIVCVTCSQWFTEDKCDLRKEFEKRESQIAIIVISGVFLVLRLFLIAYPKKETPKTEISGRLSINLENQK